MYARNDASDATTRRHCRRATGPVGRRGRSSAKRSPADNPSGARHERGGMSMDRTRSAGVVKARRGVFLVSVVLMVAAACQVPPPPPAPPPSGGGATPSMVQNGSLGGCPVLPADNPWNQDVSSLPVAAGSAAYVASIGLGGHLHADFGGGGVYGITYVAVRAQPPVPVNFTAYGSESDPGPYPVPLSAPVEGGAGSSGDRHVLAVDADHCVLYEMYRAFPQQGTGEPAS